MTTLEPLPEMQILRPQSYESETLGEQQKSAFYQALQVISMSAKC